MKQIKTNALTEKGALRTAVRNGVKAKDLEDMTDVMTELGYEYCDKKNCFIQTREDTNGVPVYTVLTMSITTTHPTGLAERKHESKPEETIEIE